jgi:hypothetical protein
LRKEVDSIFLTASAENDKALTRKPVVQLQKITNQFVLRAQNGYRHVVLDGQGESAHTHVLKLEN